MDTADIDLSHHLSSIVRNDVDVAVRNLSKLNALVLLLDCIDVSLTCTVCTKPLPSPLNASDESHGILLVRGYAIELRGAWLSCSRWQALP